MHAIETICIFIVNLDRKVFSEMAIGLLNLVKTERNNLFGDLGDRVGVAVAVFYADKTYHYLVLVLTHTEDPCRFVFLIEENTLLDGVSNKVHEIMPKVLVNFIMVSGLCVTVFCHRFNPKKTDVIGMHQSGIFFNSGIVSIKPLMAIFMSKVIIAVKVPSLRAENSVYYLYLRVWLLGVAGVTNLKILPICLYFTVYVFNFMSFIVVVIMLH